MVSAVRPLLWLLCLSLVGGYGHAAGADAADDGLFSAEGYRIARYRAALPDEPPAGRRIETGALARLIEDQNPVLVDVQAITVRPESEEFGLTWLPTRTRYHIPGSTWLPNVGYGRLQPRMLAYLGNNLERLTGGDRDRPLVFYCVVDCWMSWNAVKRAHGLGYRKLYWYPEGTDGWEEADLPLRMAQPQPLREADTAHGCGSQAGDEDFFVCGLDGLPAALSRVGDEPGRVGVLLFFETQDCPFCQRMRRGLLREQRVIDHYHRRFVVMAVDLQSQAAFTDGHGTQTTQAQYARDELRVYRTPTLVFLDADGEEVFRHAGVIVDPRVFLGLADYVSQGHVEKMGFREYLAAVRADAD